MSTVNNGTLMGVSGTILEECIDGAVPADDGDAVADSSGTVESPFADCDGDVGMDAGSDEVDNYDLMKTPTPASHGLAQVLGRSRYSTAAAFGFALALFSGCSGVPNQPQLGSRADSFGNSSADASQDGFAAPDAGVPDVAAADSIVEAPTTDARKSDPVCGDADSTGIHLVQPNFPGVTCGATVSLPAYSAWHYFTDGRFCRLGERVYKFEWKIDAPVIDGGVGAGTYAPGTNQYYKPSLGLGEQCSRDRRVCSFELRTPLYPSDTDKIDPGLWRIPLRYGAYGAPKRERTYWVLACIPERPGDGGVSEQTFHIKALMPDGGTRECCIHLR